MQRVHNGNHGALSILGVAVALAATLTVSCAHAGSGKPDANNLFPSVGAVVVMADRDHPVVVGSGVLIHPRVLLTAGHVTASGEEGLRNGIPLFDISRISFGTDAFDPDTWVEAVAIMTHPRFEATAYDAGSQDLGVIILKEPVNLPCATLAYEGFLNDLKDMGLLGQPNVSEDFVAVGYGNTIEFPPPGEQPADGLRRFAFPEYKALEHENWVILNQNLASGNTGLAAGDSGGPLFWIGPDGELIVVAVHSRADPKRAALLKDYRIDTAEALRFIELVIFLVDLE